MRIGRYVTYEYRGATRAGIVREGRVLPLGSFPDLGAFLAASDREQTDPWLANSGIPLEEVRLRAPVLRPPKIVAVGLNYLGHAEEQNQPLPERPLLFAKSPTAVIGPGQPIRLPRTAPSQVDPEVELAIVIGRGGYRIPRESAMRHVFGVTILNDVSARDVQREDRQWFRAKSFATFAPLGPVVVSCDEAPPDDLEILLRVNGEIRQRARTREMIFDVPALVEYVSSVCALEAGDVIATGTPAGVGVFRTPPVFLRAGDVVECEIERVGLLRNPVEAEA